MKPYSMDLRKRVVDAVDEGKITKWDISLLFKVSPAWIRRLLQSRLLQRRRETGLIEAKQRDDTASNNQVDEALRQRLATLVRDNPDATLRELRQGCGAIVSISTNPIEKMWSKVKSLQRAAGTRTKEALWNAICEALHAVTPTDCQGFFASCGIPVAATSA